MCVSGKPKDGEANLELRRCLSQFFDAPLSSIVVESGHKSRNKTILIQGAVLEDIEDKLLHGCEEKKT